MNPYLLLRPLLFKLEPEMAHSVTLRLLKFSEQTGLSLLTAAKNSEQPLTIMGLRFKNSLGLAAGLDKNGDYIDALAAVGFGFLEIGTVTPRPQFGNPKPRLFRLPEHQAIINRMGFNNLGVDYLVGQVQKSRYQGILGINIGKNFDTPISEATDDYLIGLRKSYEHASYITLNISSPNTKNLRQLQEGDEIKRLLLAMKEAQLVLEKTYQKYVPLVVKIAPDLNDGQIQNITFLLKEFSIDGVIATNTTLDRDKVKGHRFAKESGGLSGVPVREKSTYVVKTLADELNGTIPIIAAGGIFTKADAEAKKAAGASLVQVYSGLIYKGTQLLDDILSSL